MKVISICNAKGGCGKTTTAINLASALTRYDNNKVLLIDTDWQGNISTGLGLVPDQLNYTLADVILTELNEPTRVKDILDLALHRNIEERIDLLPSNIMLNNVEFRSIINNNAESIKSIYNILQICDYDYVIIDTAPAVDILLYMTLYASNEVIIPTQAEYFSYEALGTMIGTIMSFVENYNVKLDVAGILLTMTRDNETSKTVASAVADFAKNNNVPIFKTTVPDTVVIIRSQVYGRSVFESNHYTLAKEAYTNIAEELMAHIQKKERSKKIKGVL